MTSKNERRRSRVPAARANQILSISWHQFSNSGKCRSRTWGGFSRVGILKSGKSFAQRVHSLSSYCRICWLKSSSLPPPNTPGRLPNAEPNHVNSSRDPSVMGQMCQMWSFAIGHLLVLVIVRVALFCRQPMIELRSGDAIASPPAHQRARGRGTQFRASGAGRARIGADSQSHSPNRSHKSAVKSRLGR